MTTGRFIALIVAALIAFAYYHANHHQQQCYVTGLGAKLCGADAAAWCRTTDSLRRATSGLGANVADSTNACNEAESSYP
jgi:hypothetical protein